MLLQKLGKTDSISSKNTYLKNFNILNEKLNFDSGPVKTTIGIILTGI